MRADQWRLFLKRYWWLIGIGILIATSIVIDPFLRLEYYPEEELEIPWKWFWYLPFTITSAIILLPFLSGWLYLKIKSLSRPQQDQILIIALISTLFINYQGILRLHFTFTIVSTGFIILLIRGALAGRYDLVKYPIHGYYLVLILLMMISTYAPLGSAPVVMNQTLEYVSGQYLPILLIPLIVRSRRQLLKCIQYMFFFSLFSSVIGIGQFLVYELFHIDITGQWNTDLQQGRFATLPVLGTIIRVGALTGNADYLAYEVGVITVMMAFFLVNPAWFSRKWRKIFLIGVVMGLACCFLTTSRATWLSLAICFLIMPFILYPRYAGRFILTLLLLGAVVYMSGLYDYLYEMAYEMRTAAVDYRARYFLLGIATIRENPWIGVGFGAFRGYWNVHDDDVHVLWMNMAVQIGVFGGLVLFAYYVSLSVRLIRAVYFASPFNKVILKSFVFALIFFFVNSLLNPLIWDKFFWIFFAFVEVAIYTLGRIGERTRVYYPVFGYSWKDEPRIQLSQ